MAFLTAYFDASGTQTTPTALTVGGFIATTKEWAKFHYAWRDILNPEGIEIFRMSDLMAGEGEFVDWDDDRKNKLLGRLANVIVGRIGRGVALTIPLKQWQVVNTEYQLEACRATPYAVAAMSCIMKTGRIAKELGVNPDDVEFIFEDGDNGQDDLRWILGVIKRDVEGKAPGTKPIEPAFKSKSRELTMLQAADFAAWEQRYAVENDVKVPDLRASLKALGKFLRDCGVAGEAHLREHAERHLIPKHGEHLTNEQKRRWIRDAEVDRAAQNLPALLK